MKLRLFFGQIKIKIFHLVLEVTLGDIFGGSKFLNSASLDIRSGDKFSSSLSINTNNIKLEMIN